MIGIIQRRILFELISYMIMSLIAMSVLLTVVLAMIEAVRRGLDPMIVLKLTPYLMPPTLPYTIPTCLLFSCTIVYGSMSGNNEIIALKAAGVHAARFLFPAVFLSGILSIVGMFIVDRTIPACNRKAATILTEDIEGLMFSYLEHAGSIRLDSFPFEIYVHSVAEHRLINPIIKQKSVTGGYDLIIQAQSAELKIQPTADGKDKVLKLRLRDAVLSPKGADTVLVVDDEIDMPVPKLTKPVSEKIDSLTFKECMEFANDQGKREANLDAELSMQAFENMFTGNPSAFVVSLQTNVAKTEHLHRRYREARAELHMRAVHAIAGIPFVLLGAPVSILLRRRDFIQAFFVCFLPIIVIYYPMLILSFNFCKETEGLIHGVLWIPPALLALASLPFLRSVIRY